MRCFTLFFLLLFSNIISAQGLAFQWAKGFGFLQKDLVKDITLDATGNVYVVGYFTGMVDFDNGPGTATLVSVTSSLSYGDAFFAKFDINGQLLWVKQIGGVSEEGINSIVLDSNNNIYITGHFTGNTDFDPGVGTFTMTSSYRSAFFSKYDPSGNFLWVKGFDFAESKDIAIDENNSIYLTGIYSGTTDFNTGLGTYTLGVMSGLSSDIFIARYNSVGDFMWVKQLGSSSYDEANSLTLNKNKNVLTTGYFSKTGPNDFDPGIGTYSLIPKAPQNIFISSLDSNGYFLWAKQILGDSLYGLDFTNSIEVDKMGNIVLGGSFWGKADFDPGVGAYTLVSSNPIFETDAFILKLDSLGGFLWVDTVASASAGDAVFDVNGNVYATTNGDISKYSPNGILLWSEKLEGSNLAIDNSGNVFTGGYVYQFSPDFDPSINTYTLNWSGDQDAFVAKYNQTLSNVFELNSSNEVVIYPNPNNGLFIVDLGEGISGGLFTIYNIIGQKMMEEKISNSPMEKHMFDLHLLPKGVYIFEFRNLNKLTRNRILI